MNTRTYIYAQHGWGFDATFWQSWHEHLPADWVFETAERGYFGRTPTKSPMWPLDSSARRVIVAHSFGLHLIPPDVMRMAHALVIVSGFKRFHITEKSASVRVIRRMQLRFRDDTEGLLTDFYDQCYGKHSFEPSKPTVARKPVGNVLGNDLELMNTSMVPQFELSQIPAVVILHGDSDEVVPAVHAIQLAELLEENGRLSVCAGAGHALPYTHPAWCINRIREALSEGQPEQPRNVSTTLPASFATSL
ncbi:MAG: alpha/beta hydrolase [Candidatus Melainabacteria bacterium]|nr:alpha/beta hydrolase [Candidatus Melainabacteria bacterium]